MVKKVEENETKASDQPSLPEKPEVRSASPEADHPAGWILVRAKEPLVGGGRLVERGEEYYQPPEAARAMAAKGYVEIVE